MPVITCIEDLKRLHKAHTPRMFYDYAESGSYTEQTFRENTTDFAQIRLRQKVAVDMSGRTLASDMVGLPVTMPVGLAPVGLTGMQRADGEIKAARAAEKFGVPFCLSTMSICSIEDVAAHTEKPFMFQLYVMKDQEFLEGIIGRAKAAGCSALVLTLDLQIQGQRHNDIKNGLAVPPKLTLRNALDVMTKPSWALKVLRGRRKTFGNLTEAPGAKEGLATLSHWIAGQFDPSLSWKDVAWIRSIWPGKLILKGVLDIDDARIAADTGADAIVVSNHGGRQLDGAPSSISVLPAIAEAVGDKTEILFDGGVRSGQDVLKALALGARGCMIGKAWLYGLAAGGEAGVTQALQIIRKELDVSMALTGTRDVRDVTPEVLHAARHGDVVRPAGSRLEHA